MMSGPMAQGVGQPALPQAFRAPKATRPAAPREDQVAARRSLAAERTSLQRVAALLSGISRNNSYEGRDPAIIPDTLTSGFVAGLLGLSIADLAESLVELEHRGLVAPAPGGMLRLMNLPALDRLIDAHIGAH